MAASGAVAVTQAALILSLAAVPTFRELPPAYQV